MSGSSDASAAVQGDAGPSRPEFDLGILFVHGIGQQSPGETLVYSGDPLLKWIGQWGAAACRLYVEKLRPGSAAEIPSELIAREFARVTRATFSSDGGRATAVEAEIGVPDFAAMRRDPAGDPYNVITKRKRWLLAESCWAGVIVPPHFADLAYWGLVVYPYANASHFGAKVQRLWIAWARRTVGGRIMFAVPAALRTFGLSVLSLLVAVAGVVALVLLLILALPPIPALRSLLLRIQQALANSVGDSFILIASPVQSAAIISRINADLEALLARCARVCLVAHSQGAAASVEALRTGVLQKFPNVKVMLVTYGSGVGKLEEIRWMLGSDKQRIGWLPIVGVLLLWLSIDLLGVADVVPIVQPSTVWGIFAGFFGAFLWFVAAAYSATVRRLEEARFEPLAHFGAKCLWRDYFASHDPVPNGPLFDRDPPYMKSVEIFNFGSVWRDHTSYWENRDQFIPMLARALGCFCRLPITQPLPEDKRRLNLAACRRRWRVRWLARARMAAALLIPWLIVGQWENLAAIGRETLTRARTLEAVLRWIGADSLLANLSNADLVIETAAGVIALVLAGLLGYGALYLAWRYWNWRDATAVLQRRSIDDELPFWGFLMLGLFLCDLAVFAGAGWLPRVGTGDWPIARLAAAGNVLLLLLAGVRVWRGEKGVFGSSMRDCILVGLGSAPLIGLLLSLTTNQWLEIAALLAIVVTSFFLVRRWHPHVGPPRPRQESAAH